MSGQDMDIMYPRAFATDGATIHISDAESGGRFSCIGCGERMSAVLPNLNIASHFRHTVDGAGDRCSPDNALHAAAVGVIVETQIEQIKLRLRYPCGRTADCGHVANELDLAEFPPARKEYALAPKTRADVAFVDDSRRVAIEIVVTHDVEPETSAAYKRAGVAVYRVNISDWDDVEQLRTRVDAESAGEDCEGCVAQVRIAEQNWREKVRNLKIDARKWTEAAFIDARIPENPPQPRDVRKLRYSDGGRLSVEQSRFCSMWANRLTGLGFYQHNTDKPYLFRRRFTAAGRRGEIWVYAEIEESDSGDMRVRPYSDKAMGCGDSDYGGYCLERARCGRCVFYEALNACAIEIMRDGWFHGMTDYRLAEYGK